MAMFPKKGSDVGATRAAFREEAGKTEHRVTLVVRICNAIDPKPCNTINSRLWSVTWKFAMSLVRREDPSLVR